MPRAAIEPQPNGPDGIVARLRDAGGNEAARAPASGLCHGFDRDAQVVAIKAVTHKLARACFHVMKTVAPFDLAKAFG